jgi:hypothetical protein
MAHTGCDSDVHDGPGDGMYAIEAQANRGGEGANDWAVPALRVWQDGSNSRPHKCLGTEKIALKTIHCPPDTTRTSAYC